MASSLKKHGPKDCPLPMTLSISFSGPFLYVFQSGEKDECEDTVEIYAPYCPYHEAGFFYSDNSLSETDLWNKANELAKAKDPKKKRLGRGLRRYLISGTGIKANPNNPPRVDPVTPPPPPARMRARIRSMTPNWSTVKLPAQSSSSILPHKIMFRLSVPRPQSVYPLYCDWVEVVDGYPGKASGYTSMYATGLRFIYPADTTGPICLDMPAVPSEIGSQLKFDVTPPIRKDLPPFGDIEVRYEGFHLADVNDAHSDARSCFDSVSTMAGMQKWLNYDDGLSSPTNPGKPRTAVSSGVGILVHSGGDCYAPAVVIGLD